ncbi:HPP family protein [Helicosporidium sp. ATCC 50920]|nr:HPP family protein [Helicosporidium sp. ATCC 50920]|eukprot:KDD75504.1 HPP family protein [Helicosporidium sp. ATCC 50920]
MIFSFVGAFVSILAITAFDQWAWQPLGYPSTVASFGASAVLLFGVPDSKLAQPRNFLGGQLISAVVGVALRNAIPLPWLAMPVCCATALLLMQLTRSVHPPGGATALIAGGLNPLPRWRGWCFVVAVTVDCALMLGVALVSNNISVRRHYPTYWWSGVNKAAV